MKAGIFRYVSTLVIAALLLFSSACSTFKPVYETGVDLTHATARLILPAKKPVLKKKVLVAPLVNQAGISKSMSENITRNCVSYLEQNKYLLVTQLNESSPSPEKIREIQYGIIIDHDQVKKAEKMGMNILVSFIMHPFDTEIKKTGIWPFRKMRREINISISVNALDTINDTLLVAKNESKYVTDNKYNPDANNDNQQIDYSILKGKINSMVKDLCSYVAKDLQKHPWHTKVIKTADNIEIKAGSDVGISKNSVFDVFKRGDSIVSMSGRKIYIVGQKIGVIGVRSVSRDKTVLNISPSDKDFSEVEYARVKRED